MKKITHTSVVTSRCMTSAAPDATLANIRNELHSALALALGMRLPVGTLASPIADTGTAIGHDNPRL